MQAHVPKTPPPDCAPPRQFRSAVEELFQARVEKVTICRCEAEEVQEITEMVFPLHYPSTTLKEGKPLPYPFSTSLEGKLGELQSPTLEERVSFSSVVKSSICSEQVTQAWCTKCNAFKRVVSGGWLFTPSPHTQTHRHVRNTHKYTHITHSTARTQHTLRQHLTNKHMHIAHTTSHTLSQTHTHTHIFMLGIQV